MNTVNQEVMTTIYLGGQLGKMFGKEHRCLISRVGEAARALSKTLPGFEKFMISSQKRGLTYAVFKGKRNIGQDDLGFHVTGDVVRIVPVIIGSKRNGVLQTILGSVLVAVGALGVTLGQGFGGGVWGPAAMQVGAALALGGVVQMLSPQAKGLASKQDADNKALLYFWRCD